MTDDVLDQLVRSQPGLWRGWRSHATSWPVLPTGFAELDTLLPGGGWPLGAVLEIQVSCIGVGEVSLLVPAMASLSQSGRVIAWISPPYQPYAPALAQAGIQLRQVLVVQGQNAGDIPWSMEKLLRSQRCGMALAWPRRLSDHQARRLQLAAEEGGALAVLFPQQASGASHAALRLQARPVKEGLALNILKARGSLRRESVIVRV